MGFNSGFKELTFCTINIYVCVQTCVRVINIKSILEYDNMDVVCPAQVNVLWRFLLARTAAIGHITIYNNNTIS